MKYRKGLFEKKITVKKNIKYARKSIFAKKTIEKGRVFLQKFGIKDTSGLSPVHWNKIIRMKAIKKYSKMKKYQKKFDILTSSRLTTDYLRNLIKKLYNSKNLNIIYQSLEHI